MGIANTNQNFPPIVGIEGLSNLLNKKPASITLDRCRYPHKIPPACIPPGTQKPLWVVEDVINWLRAYQESPHETLIKKLGAPAMADCVTRKTQSVSKSYLTRRGS